MLRCKCSSVDEQDLPQDVDDAVIGVRVQLQHFTDALNKFRDVLGGVKGE